MASNTSCLLVCCPGDFGSMESGCFEHPPLRTAGTRLRRGPLVVLLRCGRCLPQPGNLRRHWNGPGPVCCPCVACTRMDSWSVRGSVWAPACKRGCALREAACPVDRARRERHALLTGRNAKGTRRSRRRGVADHRRLVSRPRATHIPACMLAPSPASASGVSPRPIVFESTRPIFQRIRRIRGGFVLVKLFLYQLV